MIGDVTRRGTASVLAAFAGLTGAALISGSAKAAASESSDILSPADRREIDRNQIEELMHRERRARDMEDWDELAACYHPDSVVDFSWFIGTGKEFAEASKGMATKLQSFHEIGGMTSQFNGNRAITDTLLPIHLIADVHDCEVDVVGYARQRLRVEKRNGQWLILGARTIYLKDMMIPTDPSAVPTLDKAKLASFRPSYKYLCYMLTERGLPARNDLAGVDRPDLVNALIKGEEDWLRG